MEFNPRMMERTPRDADQIARITVTERMVPLARSESSVKAWTMVEETAPGSRERLTDGKVSVKNGK